MSTKKYYGVESLEKKFGPLTIAKVIWSFREADDISQTKFAKKLGISKANLCDIEKGRKLVSPERAARFAKHLKISEALLVQIAIEDLLRAAKLNYKVELKKAS